MYGRMAQRSAAMRFHVYERDHSAHGGKATRTQVAILLNGHENGPRIDLLLYAPKGIKKPAVILGVNFWGNENGEQRPGNSNLSELGRVRQKLSGESHLCKGSSCDAGLPGNGRGPVERILSHRYALTMF
jgi:hypothetical protein